MATAARRGRRRRRSKRERVKDGNGRGRDNQGRMESTLGVAGPGGSSRVLEELKEVILLGYSYEKDVVVG